MKIAHVMALHGKGNTSKMPHQDPLGSGGRFAALQSKLSQQPGVTNSGALAAAIGRKKYGKVKFQQLAADGERKNR